MSRRTIFPDIDSEIIKSQWQDFKFEMTEIKRMFTTLKKQFIENKLKLKKHQRSGH